MVDKLDRISAEEKLKSMQIYLFTPREFKDIFGVSQKTASVFISRNLKSGLFLKLRNRYYMLKDSNPSLYSIANKLYQPSYISMETALSYYNIIPEVVYTVTSITAKPTREFETPRGIFSYQRIKKEVFTGYVPKQIEENIIMFAEPEKALVDYLYFVNLKKISLNDRLSLKEIDKNKLINYARLFNRPSLLKLIEKVYVEQRKPRRIY